VKEPRGDHGFEGYQLGELYKFELIPAAANFKAYYRVWPVGEDYYETCSVRTFNKYFEVVV
jgi:hypothetical protein